MSSDKSVKVELKKQVELQKAVNMACQLEKWKKAKWKQKYLEPCTRQVIILQHTVDTLRRLTCELMDEVKRLKRENVELEMDRRDLIRENSDLKTAQEELNQILNL